MDAKTTIKIILAALILQGCGGEGSPPGPPPPDDGKVLVWDAPTNWVGGQPLIPEEDLDSYEVYASLTPEFAPEDVPIAIVAPGTPSVTIASLRPSVERGWVYYLSVRAVSKHGTKSDFSLPIKWEVL